MPRADLATYHGKRDFGRTPEPRGDVALSGAGDLYLVQKHAARRLHYDLRLELDGVLKSWAVPKGPSLVPAEKRLAVEVEDHPIAYGDFEGVIPRDEYGGGTVMLWDSGRWAPRGDALEGLRRGRLHFDLFGERLRGGWVLVRTRAKPGERQKQWLLMKDRDEHARAEDEPDVLEEQQTSVRSGRTMEAIAGSADLVWRGGRAEPAERAGAGRAPDLSGVEGSRRAKQPAFIAPQLATLASEAPDGTAWLHEIKYDGYRMLGVMHGGRARLKTRRDQDWTERFAAIAAALERLPVEQAIVDGEVVILKPDGATDFQALQNSMRGGAAGGELIYYAFDLPHCAGYDLTRVPLEQRKALLRELLGPGADQGMLRYSDHIRGDGPTVFEHACRLSVEGLICKQAASRYESRRTRSWLKVKCLRRQEFVIGGYTDPSGSRSGFGALLLGVWEDGDLAYCGKVGTGFTERSLRELSKRLKALEQPKRPFAGKVPARDARGAHWVRPELVGEVQFTEWTADGVLRHPSFQGLREDKDPRSVQRELPPGPEQKAARSAKDRGRRGAAIVTSPPSRADGAVSVAGVALTNPDRVLYPELELTKLELARFDEAIAEHILPHVAGRPLSLVRCPRGHQGTCFFQKHLDESLPPALRGVMVQQKEKKAQHIVIDDLAGLISLVQLGVLEVHPWGARADNIERPDRLIFDLDPGSGVSWSDLVQAARTVHERLNDLGLVSFVKTTGGKGLHVVAPVVRRTAWDDLKSFAAAVATGLAGDEPRRYTASMSKARRAGKIYIDYLRNARGATAIAAYSTRARPGAPVSAPLRWDELEGIGAADAFDVRNLPRRLAHLKADPWEGFDDLRQSITKTMMKRAGG